MFIFIPGLILLAAPFLLVNLFSDKKRGFVYVSFFSFLFHVILALLTQSFGVFKYNVIIGCLLLADVLLFFIAIKKSKRKFSFSFKNIDWVVIAVSAISIFTLYQVHYNYNGKINLAIDQVVSYHEVKNMVYPYPYFSDEWYAVSLIEGAINSHSLPVNNILNNSFFLNLELFFHSFLAELTLLLGLNALLHYTVLSIFLNSLIIILAYLFLRISGVSKLASGICSLLMLYITCGANLPGLWNLMPFNLGIIFFLMSICLMELKNIKLSIAAVILSSLFYPPLFPFYFIGLSVFLTGRIKNKKTAVRIVLITLLVIFLILSLLYISLSKNSSTAGFTKYIFSRIFFVSFTAPSVPQLIFYNIVPLPAILLAIWGAYEVYKNKKWVLLSELILGVAFWIVYSFTLYRFFAEYERVVIFASIIITIVSGFGLRYVERYVEKRFSKWGDALKFAEIAILVIFLFLAPFYTQAENWKKIVYVYPEKKATFFPKAPANNYLTQEDVRIFKNIKGKKFLSIPWKGTVVGVATGNYPVLTKEGTISIGFDKVLNDFYSADCKGKKKIAKIFNLEYIYIYMNFNCPGFKNLDKSSEGFILYKVI